MPKGVKAKELKKCALFDDLFNSHFSALTH